jgi:RHS repeat-associated protein
MGPKRGPLNFPGRAAPGTGDNTTDRLGFDGSGRMITKRYLTGGINGSTYAYNNTSALVGQTTAYDHGGNKFYERSLQAADRSNLYQPVDNTGNIASPAPGYDSVNRLLQYQRGTLNGTGGYQNNGGGSVSSAIGLPNTDQSRTYSLDGLGNWKKSVYTAEGGTSAADVRNNNYVNQITQRTLAGSPQSALNYDENGNTTVAPAGLSYAEAVIASGPSLYWRLDETSGTTAADLSGNGDDGTYSTGVSFGQPGALLTSANMAVGFPGTGSVVNQEALNFSNTTVAAWVKLAALPTKGPQMIAGFAQAAQTQPSAPAINTSVLYVDISGNANWVVNDGTTAYTVASGPLQVGKWYFLVGTADGTTSTLYVNGSLAASTSAGSSQVGFVVPNFLVNGNAGFYGGVLNAVVDEVAAYDFALTAQQIAGLYSAALAQPQVEMQYDALNRLIAVNRVSDGAAIAAYVYDAGNRRVRKTVTNGGLAGNIPNGTTDSCWFGWQTMEERNPSGGTDTAIKQYVWGTYIDECIQINLLQAAGPQQLAVGAYYPLQDTLYRTMALVNSSGTPVEAYDADAYGNTIIFTGPGADSTWFTDDDTQSTFGANSIIYCGYRYDAETDNYYVRNRYYSPTLGRWLTRDPIGYEGGVNLYEYVMSDPRGYTDSFGQIPLVLDRLEFLTVAQHLMKKIYNASGANSGKTAFDLLQRGEILAGEKLHADVFETIATDWVTAIVKDTFSSALKVLFSDEGFAVALVKTVGKAVVKHLVKDLVNQLKKPKEMVGLFRYGSSGGKGNYAKAFVTYDPSSHEISAFVAGRVAANTSGSPRDVPFPIFVGRRCPYREFEFEATGTVWEERINPGGDESQGNVRLGILGFQIRP